MSNRSRVSREQTALPIILDGETTDNCAASPGATCDLPVEHSAQAERPSNPKARGSSPPEGAEQGERSVSRRCALPSRVHSAQRTDRPR